MFDWYAEAKRLIGPQLGLITRMTRQLLFFVGAT